MRTLPVARALLLIAACGSTTWAFAPAGQAPASRPGTQAQPPRVPGSPGAPVRDPGGRGPVVTPGTSTLTGTVTTATGQPAAGARVMISGPDNPPRTMMTDSQGRFSFANLRASRYFLNVTKPGFVNVSYGQRRPNGSCTAIPLRDGEKRDVAVQMPRVA